MLRGAKCPERLKSQVRVRLRLDLVRLLRWLEELVGLDRLGREER